MADNDTPQNDQDNISNLRKAADEAAKAKNELAQAQRELAFARAGIDTEKGVGALLFKAYDGELTKEAIQAQASELGILNPPATDTGAPATPPPAEPQVDTAQTQARLDLASGGAPANPPEENPFRSAMNAYEEAVRTGLDPEYASAAAFEKVFKAAAAGDRRVLL